MWGNRKSWLRYPSPLLRAGPPQSVSQYQTENVATLAIQSRAASRNNAGADVPALNADETKSTVLTTTATVTNPITPKLMRRARRWLPRRCAVIRGTSRTATSAGTKASRTEAQTVREHGVEGAD